jgi:hypothetical protein
VAASSPNRSTPQESAAGTHWLADRIGPRTALDNVEKRTFYLYWYSKSNPSAVQPLQLRDGVFLTEMEKCNPNGNIGSSAHTDCQKM